jgi:hypothetical protein
MPIEIPRFSGDDVKFRGHAKYRDDVGFVDDASLTGIDSDPPAYRHPRESVDLLAMTKNQHVALFPSATLFAAEAAPTSTTEKRRICTARHPASQATGSRPKTCRDDGTTKASTRQRLRRQIHCQQPFRLHRPAHPSCLRRQASSVFKKRNRQERTTRSTPPCALLQSAPLPL